MPDQPPAPTSDQGGQDAGTTPPGDDKGFQPITTQEDLNRVIAERVNRERAKYADHADLKAKAARLDVIEAANKTELDKANEALAQAQADAVAAQAEMLRFRIAAEHGITGDAAKLLTGTDEETLADQARTIAAMAADAGKPRPPKPDPAQGRPGGAAASNGDQFAAFFNNQLGG